MSAAERWIPYRVPDLVDILADEAPEPTAFRDLHRIVAAVVHHQHQMHLERLSDAYAPFAHDVDYRVVKTWTEEQRVEAQRVLVSELTELVEAANYERIDETVIGQAIEAQSLLKLRLQVDLDDFDEMLFFCRGASQRTEEVRDLYGLRRRDVTFTNYDRVLLYLKFKDARHFAEAGREDLLFTPGSTIVKLFQNVPRADLEMLFPNAEARMRTIDKVVIGVPAVVSGAVVLATKLAASLGLLFLLVAFWVGVRDEEVNIGQTELAAIAIGLGSILAFVWRQWNKFKNRRIKFMKMLSDNLYFRNLDNDVGVFHHLVGVAEQEEIKEILLAHRFLLEAPGTATDLDGRIEAWFRQHLSCTLDFEVADALDKLTDLDLVERRGDTYHAVPVAEARRRLGQRWDEYFGDPRLSN